MANSATEDALASLKTILAADATAHSKYPAPLRNEDLSARMTEIGSKSVACIVNIWDGSQTNREEVLGVDNIDNGYEITLQAKIEVAVVGGDTDADREAALDAALQSIFDAIKADRTLAGKVSWAEFGLLEFQGSNLVTDGIPHAKGVIIPVDLTFQSSRPF